MIQLIRGFKDILPEEVALWQWIERTARDLFEGFGYGEIRIPIMERTELFARSIGEQTDIVEKEMYTFPDRKGEMITLRPEATASVVRAYIQHRLYAHEPVQKFYTIGPMFRRERPQKGRYRQFYQINVEVFGIASALIDAQLILMLVTLMERLAVEDVHVHANSLGCPACRPDFRRALSDYLASRTDSLCSDCRRRSHKNPLRVLDCKVPGCRTAMGKAPSITDYLCGDCRAHFDTFRAALDELEIDYVIDPRLVRGLDYYTRTTFEIQTGSLGAQSAVAGGGRYDGLVEALGGPDMPATGFAIGLDRLAELVAAQGAELEPGPDLFIAALGDESRRLAFGWVCDLGLAGVQVEMEYGQRSLKSQMKRANRLKARWVLILGENELAAGKATLRDMQTREQQEVPLADVVQKIKILMDLPRD
jgi:histidyl-tRNA synthetase